MSKLTEGGLIKLKDRIDHAKVEIATFKSRRKDLLLELKAKFGCTTIEQAEKKEKQLAKTIGDINLEIEDELDVIMKQYPDLEVD